MRSGVREGDILLIHSNIGRTIVDYSRTSGARIGPEEVLESFIEAVGPSGTLLFPLFNFEFTQGAPFDIRSTPSHMGAITELARKYQGSVRTGHPIYSFCALGRHSHHFKNVCNKNAYSEDSPFGILKRLGGKIAVLDLPDSKSMTFYHHVEEVMRVQYRYFKDFTGEYIDENGNSSQRTHNIYVRDLLKGAVSNSDPAGELLWRAGLYIGCRPQIDTGLRTISAKSMYDFVADLITNGDAEGNLFIYRNKT